MQRDEKIWRGASTDGVNPDGSLILQGLRTWETWVIFIVKALVPWLFGFGVSCNRNIFFATIPMVVMAALFLILAGFVEWIVRRKPTGTQPAAYGDVRVLGELVDDWGHERIFWGDRRVYNRGVGMEAEVRLAGTAGERLADVREGVRYVGLGRGE